MQGFEMNQQHLIATIIFGLILGANAFSYKEAKHWRKTYPKCNGKNQSPIFLKRPSEFIFPSINQTLKYTHFDKLPTKMTMQNSGHAVEIKAEWSGEPPRFTGGPLHANYVFEKISFHWAQRKWSERTDDSQDLEMRMYFYKTDLKSFEKAQSQKDGLAVIKMWFQTGYADTDHWYGSIQDNLNKVQSINSSAEIPPFPFPTIYMHGDIIFQFYKGSLDYPPCSESVNWFIYDNVNPICNKLINEFRKIKLAEGDVSNVRPLQALNNRKVESVFNT